MATPNDIYNEITRIDNAKQGIAEAIEEKGVQVPAGTPIQDFPGKVRQIQTGSPDAVLYTPQDLTPEQQEQARENIGAGTYTKPNTGIPVTDFAQGVQTSLEKADTALQPAALTPITELIPEQATPQNQLADKNFVNSSVATNTANYISDNGQPFQSVADLEAYTGTLTNNDYAFVVGTDSAGNTTYTRYKYNATTQTWAAEYVLNNSSFTAEQWAAISSGITALLVSKLQGLPDGSDVLKISELATALGQGTDTALTQKAATDAINAADKIFPVIYDTTEISAIQAAVVAGKIPVCIYRSVIFVYSNESSTEILFTSSIQTFGKYLRITKANNTWYAGQISLENVANKATDVSGNRTSITKYPSVKAVFDSLGKWGVVSQTQTWTGTVATGYDYTMSNQVYGLIPQANIDLYTAAGAVFNENTGYFELNGLTDISYQEMMDIYSAPHMIPTGSAWDRRYISRKNLRTNIPYITDTEIGSMGTGGAVSMFLSSSIETIVFGYFSKSHISLAPSIILLGINYMFGRCAHLKSVKRLYMTTTVNSQVLTSAFTRCYSLETIELYRLGKDVSFSDSSRLNLLSIVYMVDNAINTNAITITLHATAYARCQADTTEYTYNGQTYTGIIAYAAAKNITIASA